MTIPGSDYLAGRRPVLTAWVRLGILIPVLAMLGSAAILGAANLATPGYRGQTVFILIFSGLGYWVFASAAIFRCALNEKKNPWLGGASLFLIPFQAIAIMRGLVGSFDAILALVGI